MDKNKKEAPKKENLCKTCTHCKSLNYCTIGAKFGNDNIYVCKKYKKHCHEK